jgi:hypothetical protein
MRIEVDNSLERWVDRHGWLPCARRGHTIAFSTHGGFFDRKSCTGFQALCALAWRVDSPLTVLWAPMVCLSILFPNHSIRFAWFWRDLFPTVLAFRVVVVVVLLGFVWSFELFVLGLQCHYAFLAQSSKLEVSTSSRPQDSGSGFPLMSLAFLPSGWLQVGPR